MRIELLNFNSFLYQQFHILKIFINLLQYICYILKNCDHETPNPINHTKNLNFITSTNQIHKILQGTKALIMINSLALVTQ